MIRTIAAFIGQIGEAILCLWSALLRALQRAPVLPPVVPPPVVARPLVPPIVPAAYTAQKLDWPVARSTHPIRVYVVEPFRYEPGEHAGIFGAALRHLLAPPVSPIDPFAPSPAPPGGARSFDLLTFPEAFLPVDALVEFLSTTASGMLSSGCIHVGLRPPGTGTHMFALKDLAEWVATLRQVENLVGSDLDAFAGWVQANISQTSRANVACLLMRDAEGRLRICLHPKIVRSRVEHSAFEELHMLAGNLLTLVTLRPVNPVLIPVTIQPVICADILALDTDVPDGGPLRALNVASNIAAFGDPPPDHVDLVSVAICSPQVQTPRDSSGNSHYRWHMDFLDAFRRAADDQAYLRHRHAAFVLSNFRTMPVTLKRGGLSGVFLPLPIPPNRTFPPYCQIYGYGRIGGGENSWSRQPTPLDRSYSCLGHVVVLDGDVLAQEAVALLGFTIDLPRDTNRFREIQGATAINLGEARITNEADSYSFQPRATARQTRTHFGIPTFPRTGCFGSS